MDLSPETNEANEAKETDEALMRRIAVGDDLAFRSLVERHQRLVIGTVARMIGPAEAEDVAQQVFINVWKSAPRWRPTAKFTTWLLTITKRLVFNESRRRGRARLLPQSPLSHGEEHLPEYPDSTPGPDGQMLERELHHAIESAMASLPEKERLAVVLRRHEERSYEEIALVLGVSLPAVKSLLFRARNTLKQRLAPYLDSSQG
jgi:RNA polymerase sigma-70 factor (ECF subfamily)